MKDLFTIGEMHKLFAVPVRTLRFYDEIGLLRPERVDPRTGYRYYSAGQFERLNTIKYLRALGVSLERIRGFFENRDTDVVELLLQEQLADTRRRLDELQRIERRIGRRLDDLRRARTAKTGVVLQKALPARAIAFLRQEIPQGGDLETPLAELQSHIRQDAAVFLGKVGVSIARERLYARQFDRYTGIFLFVEPEEQYGGPVLHLPAGEWLTVCYRGTHAHSAPSYELLLDEAARRGFELAEDSVEVTHIDAGFTSDETQYLTELQVPVKKSENTS
ncbi:Multidrug-efflux transporter 1 regulator [uncultured Butyricicoccus sp.]|uniref:MerR family transcriptional regulator n=1 Tax=Agathobaculum ammoniilyticum TaxID=2981778 RepID=A0ABT2U4Y4_9FIRM|nr:MerR family transcriptional regulator [Agathobaculum ammoniilyticum]MBS6882211.1 MerR family transcriptional regulator [Clostridiaceae bacterium]MCU6789276.1 MerR family transcriptional regulator [Agathobaculum ammoniilyticum]SCJ13661.1 Multidrug-efflux transporter 1 regulator [uncultured Butyricicoccus sp.]